eukprot:g8469.t1
MIRSYYDLQAILAKSGSYLNWPLGVVSLSDFGLVSSEGVLLELAMKLNVSYLNWLFLGVLGTVPDRHNVLTRTKSK